MALIVSCRGHAHMCKAILRRGSEQVAEMCSTSWACLDCESTGTEFRRPTSNLAGVVPGADDCAPCGLNDPATSIGLGMLPFAKLPELPGAPPRTGLYDWTTMPAAHWDAPEVAPATACISGDAYGARGVQIVAPGDEIEATLYVGSNHDGLYRYELACGAESEHGDFAEGAISPWKAPSLAASQGRSDRDVGWSRAETDAYFQSEVRCQGAPCAEMAASA